MTPQASDMPNVAPVALFVYDRVDNTRRTVKHLLDNTRAAQTDLYVFSDGGRDTASWKKVEAVRRYLHEMRDKHEGKQLRRITLVERPENFYLERNITEGIAEVLRHHDRIIVLEDDICTSPHFLQFMNDALDTYADDHRVMHVAGFSHLALERKEEPDDTFFTQHMSGWGWATWRDRWQTHFRHYTTREEALEGLTPDDLERIQYGGAFTCLNSLDKRPIPWDICWELAIYRQGGVCVAPRRTLVRNIGLYNGTHFHHSRLLQRFVYDRRPWPHALQVVYRQPECSPITEQLFAETIRHWGIRYTLLGHIVRTIYLRWKETKQKTQDTNNH